MSLAGYKCLVIYLEIAITANALHSAEFLIIICDYALIIYRYRRAVYGL